MTHRGPIQARPRRENLAKLLHFPPPAELVQARDTLARLRGLHHPFGIYPECDCKWDDEAAYRHERAPVIDCDSFETCEPPMWFVCAHCCRDVNGEYLTLECTEHHDHGPGKPHCATAAILGGTR